MNGPAFAGRVTDLNDASVGPGAYVLYWMQQSQRVAYNHALEYSVGLANELGVPPLVCFALDPSYPEATARHYRFMLEGLCDCVHLLRERGIAFVLRIGDPPEVALGLAGKAAAIVCDRGYLAHQREWRRTLARSARRRVIEVESDLTVPVEEVSLKREYAARTIRPRVHRQLERFLVELPQTAVARPSLRLGVNGEEPNIDRLMARLRPHALPGPVTAHFRGGPLEATRRLQAFLTARLPDYERLRNEPAAAASSGLSPYLHFGQISELQIALEAGAPAFARAVGEGHGRMSLEPGSVGIRTAKAAAARSRDAFLEELLVRRSLGHNYVWFTRDYHRYDALPQWAVRTLEEHRSDPRPRRYTDTELEGAETDDEDWNASMREMTVTGFMHNYMRMYWGKKLLEWTDDPRSAFERVLRLNNRYFLDGRDANSFANVGWIFGLHDRPWAERAVFGTVRSMTSAGLRRKFDMASYRRKTAALAGAT